jgi:hypothetical protein
MAEQQKWLVLFLKKHGANVELEELPLIPIDTAMSTTLLMRLTTLVPTDVLEQVDAYTRFMLDPPLNLKRFIARLKSDETKRDKVDVKHFLFLFDQKFILGRDVLGTLRTTKGLIDLVHHDWSPSTLPLGKGITLQHIQSVTLSHLAVALHTYDEHPDHWDWLVGSLRHNRSLSKQQFTQWKNNCRPLLEQAVQMVKSKRTPDWLQDSERKPSVLPSTSKLELWLLDYPSFHTKERSVLKAQSRELGAQLNNWLREKRGRSRSTHLVEDVLTVTELLSPLEIVYVATVIGTPEFRNESEEILRVDVAKAFIEKVGVDGIRKLEEPASALRRDVRDMVTKGWEKSLQEDVRQVCVDWRTKNRALWNEITKPRKEDGEVVDEGVGDA